MSQLPPDNSGPDIDDALAADLAALADGSLDPARREQVLREVAGSPHAEAMLQEQQRALALLAKAGEAGAPDALEARVQELVEARRRGRLRTAGARRSRVRGFRRPALALTAAAVIAVAAVLGVVLSSGSSTHAPTLSAFVAIGDQPATAGAPRKVPGGRPQLDASVDGVSFPYWEDRFGWTARGMRGDAVDHHAVTTVFYGDSAGGRVAYSIVAGTPPPISNLGAPHSGTHAIWRNGVRYWVQSVNGVPTVVWLRDGRRCIVSGRGLSTSTLLALASWSDSGTAA